MGNLKSAKGLPGRPVDLPNSVQNNKNIHITQILISHLLIGPPHSGERPLALASESIVGNSLFRRDGFPTACRLKPRICDQTGLRAAAC